MPTHSLRQIFISFRARLMAGLLVGLVTALISLPILQTYADGAGYALQFDGVNDLVELPATLTIMGSGWQTTKTVSFWVKPAAAGAACANNNVAWCDNVLGDRPRWWGISQGSLSGQDRLWLWNYDGSAGSPADLLGVEYTPGVWVHIALVHSDGVMRAYRNGVEVGTTPSGATQQPNTGALPKLHLGGVINSVTRNWTFAGVLDEVSLWNVARTPAEIQQGLYQTLVGSEPGLMAYYGMSNGSGTVLTDDSVNSWDGVLLDGANGVPPNGNPPLWVISEAFGGGGPTTTPSWTPTATSTSEPTNSPTPTATWTSTATPTVTSTPTVTATPTSTSPPTSTNPPTFTPTATATSSGGFPSTGVLDDFNRPNGVVGAQWSGSTASYAIAGNLLDVNGNGNILWNAASLGANQEAFVTLTTIGLNSNNLSLLLKSQSNTTANNGVIRVMYIPSNQMVQAWTYALGQGWVQHGAGLAVALVNGDQFGAKASASGLVEIYKNGVVIGSRNISSWTHAAAGGYIGLWAANASNAVLDNFGGGTAAGN